MFRISGNMVQKVVAHFAEERFLDKVLLPSEFKSDPGERHGRLVEGKESNEIDETNEERQRG